MKEEKEHETKKWEVSIIELRNGGKRYKVTRKIPELSVSETKVFPTKEEALEQFRKWLD